MHKKQIPPGKIEQEAFSGGEFKMSKQALLSVLLIFLFTLALVWAGLPRKRRPLLL
jgi:hypothetical protein